MPLDVPPCPRSRARRGAVALPILLACAGAAALAGPTAPRAAAAQDPDAVVVPPPAARAARSDAADTTLFGRLHWRTLGPDGNRASAVVGEPGDPLVAYVGAASGGVWKTEDGGSSWRPVFDDEPAQSIGALAVAPSAHNEVWAGTGEPFYIRLATALGNGVYKSTDAGKTWRHVGLEKTGRIARIVVHPRDPDEAWVCAVGSGYVGQDERGVFRTRDGGRTWEKVLFVDRRTGCSDLALDPHDPNTLFAGMWQLRVDPWDLHSGGPGGGVFVSHDGGDSWKEISGHGFPADTATVGKVSVAVAPSDPDRVYALLQQADPASPGQAGHPALYRSDDGGSTWRLVSRDHSMAERGPYYTRMRVSPADPDRLYFASVRFGMSRDGGSTLADDPPRGGGDNHDIWIDPTDADRYMVAHDGGASITLDGGRSFQRVVLPIAQMYHVYADDRVPYDVYGNRQDDGSYRGPSRVPGAYGISDGEWTNVGGCESGFAVPDTVSNDVVWSGCYDGQLGRTVLSTGHERDVTVWPEAGYGVAPRDKKYRWNWTFPIAISPFDPERVYAGSQVVHRTTDGGQSWQAISPDLTRDDTAREGSSGGVSVDNLNTFSAATLSSIAESPAQEGVIWTGSYDGLVHVTRDDGAHWTDVTANIPGLPAWGRVSNVEPSHTDGGGAYVAVDLQEQGDYAPYVYETRDYGAHWKRIDAGIPRSTLSFVHVVREDPSRPGLLYVGTENGVWVSLDDGGSWRPLQADLPHAPVYWLTVQPHFHDLLAATYGRGIWILDDVTPLEAMAAAGGAGSASGPELYAPRPAYRFRAVQARHATPSHVVGENAPYGASLTWRLPAAADSSATFTILDGQGDTVRVLRAHGKPGLNRTWWDLRYEDVETPHLRTPPPGAPWVETGPEGWRPIVPWDLDLSQAGPLVPPGTYQVVLSAGGTSVRRSLEVRKDPNTKGTPADVAKQTDMALRIRADMDTVATLVDRLEWLRLQLSSLHGLLTSDSAGVGGASAAALAGRTAAAADSALAVEGLLFDVHLTGAREDAFRHPNRLWSRYGALLKDVAEEGADFPPTDQQGQVFDLLHSRLRAAREAYGRIVGSTVPSLREALRGARIPFALPAGGPAGG
ncbi:MAG TPA: glycosyl hydrolase [Gemmatimonadota bacterium]|nr:glycosyl hydrolase [Gemmatimonadota bacterium]